MKKPLLLLTAFLILACLYGCASEDVERPKEVSAVLTYHHIQEQLSQEDANTVYEILNGKKGYGPERGIPGCGFSEDVAIAIDDLTYCMAMDECVQVWIAERDEYFTISQEERDRIEAIFAEFGGTFPAY